MATKNDITKDEIKSKPNNDGYRNNYDNISWDRNRASRGGKPVNEAEESNLTKLFREGLKERESEFREILDESACIGGDTNMARKNEFTGEEVQSRPK